MYFLKNRHKKTKINLILKKNPIIIFSSLIFKKENNRLKLEQTFSRSPSSLTLVSNKIVGKVLMQTIFKNLSNICTGPLCFIFNIKHLELKKKSKLFDIICIKFFNKIYFINQFSFLHSLEFLNSLKQYVKITEKCVKFFFYKFRNNVI